MYMDTIKQSEIILILQSIKKESKVVQQIYKWYTEEGYGAAKIANMLNEKGYKTKTKLQMESECNLPYFDK